MSVWSSRALSQPLAFGILLVAFWLTVAAFYGIVVLVRRIRSK